MEKIHHSFNNKCAETGAALCNLKKNRLIPHCL
jgi:hypothetical protein